MKDKPACDLKCDKLNCYAQCLGLNPWKELEKVFVSIEKERRHQNTQWGGYPHDDDHNHFDWCCYILKFLGRASIGVKPFHEFDHAEFRKNMVNVASLACAAIEWVDRNFK